MYFHKYSKYKPSISENHIKPVGIFGNCISKCPNIRRKRRPISLHRVLPGQSNKVKSYSSSVGSPCSVFFSLLRFLEELSPLKIYQNNKGNLSNTEISQLQKTHYKSPCNWIKFSVSLMTSAEEGQPPSNEPEEWQDTHPLSPLRWGTTLLTM